MSSCFDRQDHQGKATVAQSLTSDKPLYVNFGSAPLLEMRDLAAQALGTPHRMPEKCRIRL